MVKVDFEYRDALSGDKWNKQSCVVSSEQECIRIYGLGVDCEYRITEVTDLTQADNFEGHFANDEEKMRDFKTVSKKDFLMSYSYLTSADYDATVRYVMAHPDALKCKDAKQELAKPGMLTQLLSMAITGHLDEYFDPDFPCDLRSLGQTITQPLYRGLHFPNNLLSPGKTLEQWGDCTHWTTKRPVAEHFANSLAGSLDCMMDYAEEKFGINDVETVKAMFSKVVFQVDTAVNAIPTGKLLSENVDRIHEPPEDSGYETLDEMWERLLPEDEVTIFDTDFEIVEVSPVDENGIVYAKVKQKINCPEWLKPILTV